MLLIIVQKKFVETYKRSMYYSFKKFVTFLVLTLIITVRCIICRVCNKFLLMIKKKSSPFISQLNSMTLIFLKFQKYYLYFNYHSFQNLIACPENKRKKLKSSKPLHFLLGGKKHCEFCLLQKKFRYHGKVLLLYLATKTRPKR